MSNQRASIRRRRQSRREKAPSRPQANATPSTTSDSHPILEMQRTIGNQATLQRLGVKVAPRRRRRATHIQRGEAGVHHGIEFEALGVDDAHNQNAQEVYVGNWMRDFSQAFVPTVFNALSAVPQDLGNPTGKSIGGRGAEPLLVGALRALASLEFEEDVVDNMITGQNIGTYQPEEHMDNPAGLAASGDSLTRNADGVLEPGNVGDLALQQPGSAIDGPQLENPDLFGVSAEGLGLHIYNTKERAKTHFAESYNSEVYGDTEMARMHLGTGLHGIEDYFSHSNFIEVGLNILIRENPPGLPQSLRDIQSDQPGGGAVDTLYDVNVGDRQAITTGTFTSTDTQVSLAHVLLPRLPGLLTSIDSTIDNALLGIQQEGASWETVKAQLKSAKEGRAFLNLLTGMEDAGIQVPAKVLDMYTIPDLPSIVPNFIEQFEGREIPIGMHDESLSPSQAIDAYEKLYKTAKDVWAYKNELLTALVPLAALLRKLGQTDIAQAIQKAIDMLRKSLADLMRDIANGIRQWVRQTIMDMIERMLGVDVPEAKRQVLEEWLHMIHEGVEKKVHSSALETQLKDPSTDVGKLQPGSDEYERRIPSGALPPSHSEISKDHPSLEEHGDTSGHTVHGPSPESIFYRIHRNLAVAADQHIVALMDRAWANATGNQLIEGQEQEFDPDEMDRRNMEASKQAYLDQNLAAIEGRRNLQSEMMGMMSPDLQDVLNTVDLYISHPVDTQWWRPIVMDYLSSVPEEVIAEQIMARNETRGLRGNFTPRYEKAYNDAVQTGQNAYEETTESLQNMRDEATNYFKDFLR